MSQDPGGHVASATGKVAGVLTGDRTWGGGGTRRAGSGGGMRGRHDIACGSYRLWATAHLQLRTRQYQRRIDSSRQQAVCAWVEMDQCGTGGVDGTVKVSRGTVDVWVHVTTAVRPVVGVVEGCFTVQNLGRRGTCTGHGAQGTGLCEHPGRTPIRKHPLHGTAKPQAHVHTRSPSSSWTAHLLSPSLPKPHPHHTHTLSQQHAR